MQMHCEIKITYSLFFFILRTVSRLEKRPITFRQYTSAVRKIKTTYLLTFLFILRTVSQLQGRPRGWSILAIVRPSSGHLRHWNGHQPGSN